MKVEQRDITLDLLRFLGIIVIIMAYCRPPDWLFQLRNFGAPLLVLVSAMSYSLIYAHRDLQPAQFLRRRLLRLVVPVWLFLTFLFFAILAVTIFFQTAYPFSAAQVIQSYFFLDGIGFVWVFRVYILLALLTPLALTLSKKPFSNLAYFSALLGIYVLYELLIFIGSSVLLEPGAGGVADGLLSLIPYALLYFYGLRIHELSNWKLLGISIASSVVFLALMIVNYFEGGGILIVQKYKYPLTVHYLSYAFSAINGLVLLSRLVSIRRASLRTIIVWLSSNSIWVYLWHIMAFFIWRAFLDDFFEDALLAFVANFLFVVGFAIAATFLQQQLANEIRQDGRLGRRVASFLV